LAARGATVRAGDFDDAASLLAAFAGATRVLLVSTDAVGARVAQHQRAIDAAKAAGASLIAYISVPIR
jgi:NAD(P)H dehydrogenase (quinone)